MRYSVETYQYFFCWICLSVITIEHVTTCQFWLQFHRPAFLSSINMWNFSGKSRLKNYEIMFSVWNVCRQICHNTIYKQNNSAYNGFTSFDYHRRLCAVPILNSYSMNVFLNKNTRYICISYHTSLAGQSLCIVPCECVFLVFSTNLSRYIWHSFWCP